MHTDEEKITKISPRPVALSSPHAEKALYTWWVTANLGKRLLKRMCLNLHVKISHCERKHENHSPLILKRWLPLLATIYIYLRLRVFICVNHCGRESYWSENTKSFSLFAAWAALYYSHRLFFIISLRAWVLRAAPKLMHLFLRTSMIQELYVSFIFSTRKLIVL